MGLDLVPALPALVHVVGDPRGPVQANMLVIHTVQGHLTTSHHFPQQPGKVWTQQTVSVKDQKGNVGFAGHLVSATTTPLWPSCQLQTTKNEHGCPSKAAFTETVALAPITV